MKLIAHIITKVNETKKEQAYDKWARATFSKLELADDATVNFNRYWTSIYVYNRDDLAKLLTLAPTWKKSPSRKTISYTAEVGSYTITIYAGNAALPPTCHVITEMREHPARPAYTEEVERIVCDV